MKHTEIEELLHEYGEAYLEYAAKVSEEGKLAKRLLEEADKLLVARQTIVDWHTSQLRATLKKALATASTIETAPGEVYVKLSDVKKALDDE